MKKAMVFHTQVSRIKPSKIETERISKVVLDKINPKLIEQLIVNQWKNTQTVVDWFIKTEEKSNHKFII